jgi:RNA polymerase sigma-70 factor (ECF subfamily)
MHAVNSPADQTDVDYQDLLNRAIEAHYNDIKAAVRRQGHSRASAGDLVHDLYVKLASKPEVLEGKRSLSAFLCRTAINLGIDRLRRSRFEQNLFSGSETEALAVAADAAAPDHRLDVEARLAVLRSAIAELPEKRRAVFILHRLHHRSPDQIAGEMGITRNMVDRHLRRALAHCLDRLFEME